MGATPAPHPTAPALDLRFIRGDHKPSGLGEPGVMPVAPAIANAAVHAVGVRLRGLPLRAGAVRATLQG